MSADNVAALVAASRPPWPRSCSSGSSSCWVGGCASSAGPSRSCAHETVPLVHDARVVVDQAATEMVRVGDVLDSAEAVSSTVDSASRLAYRAFSNPVVKVLAYGTGLGSALRRFFGRAGADDRGAAQQRPRWTCRVRATDATRPGGARRGGFRRRRPRPLLGRASSASSRRGEAVMRRPLWLAAGAALGVGGTVWTRRRLDRLSEPRAADGDGRPNWPPSRERTRRGTLDRVRDAVDTGRSGAAAPGRPVAGPRGTYRPSG